MEENLFNNPATVEYWDGNARWHKLWVEHNEYNNNIIEILTTFVLPGWKVLDIGAGNGVLSLPLCAIGCEVIAIEPSREMRRYSMTKLLSGALTGSRSKIRNGRIWSQITLRIMI